MNNPKVTVLMSAYNAEKYLAEAIESVLNQTFKDFELIIINDNSSDKTGEIIKEYTKKDGRIRPIDNEKNWGLTRSLNIGLEQARGEYVARLDADDVAGAERLEKQWEFMKEHPELAMSGCWAEIIDERGQPKGQIRGETRENLLRFKMLTRNQFVHSTFFFRTEVVRAAGGYNEQYKYVQDYELTSRLLKKYRLNNQPAVLVKFRTHDQAITKNLELKDDYKQYALKVIETNINELVKIDHQLFLKLAEVMIIKNSDKTMGWHDYWTTRKTIKKLGQTFIRREALKKQEARIIRQEYKNWQGIILKKLFKSQWPKVYNLLKITTK